MRKCRKLSTRGVLINRSNQLRHSTHVYHGKMCYNKTFRGSLAHHPPLLLVRFIFYKCCAQCAAYSYTPPMVIFIKCLTTLFFYLSFQSVSQFTQIGRQPSHAV